MSGTVGGLMTAKGGLSGKISFFSLPGEIRNEIYQFYAEERIQREEHERYTDEFGWNFDIPGHHDPRSMYPKLPALMQTSKEVRSEFSTFYNQSFSIRCHDYANFCLWTRGVGKALINNLCEIDLHIEVSVKLISKNSSPQGAELIRHAPAYLRVHYNDDRARGLWEDHGFTARFWFDLVNDPGWRSPKYSDVAPLDYGEVLTWSITQSDIGRVGRKFDSRLPWDRPFSANDVLQLTQWLSGQNILICYSPLNAYPGTECLLVKNAFTVRELAEERVLSAVHCPSDLCPDVSGSIIWEKSIR